MDPEQRQRIIGYFLEESQEYLELLEPGVQDLANALADPERINELYRAAHSIKGGAAMLELHGIQKVSYRLESSLKYMKGNPGVDPNADIEATLLQGVTSLKTLTQEVRDTFELSEASSNEAWTVIEPAFDHLDNVLAQQVEVAAASENVTESVTEGAASGIDGLATDGIDDLSQDLAEIGAALPEVTDTNDAAGLDELSWDDLDDLADLSDLNTNSDSGAWIAPKPSEAGESPIEGLDELANLFEENPLENDDSWSLDNSETGIDVGNLSQGLPASGDDAEQSLDDLFSDDLLGEPADNVASDITSTSSTSPSNPQAQNAAFPSEESLDASFDDLFDAVDQSLENDGSSLGLDLSTDPESAAVETNPSSAAISTERPVAGNEFESSDELDLDGLDLGTASIDEVANALENLDGDLATPPSEPSTSAPGIDEPQIDAFSTAAAVEALDSLETELGYKDGTAGTTSQSSNPSGNLSSSQVGDAQTEEMSIEDDNALDGLGLSSLEQELDGSENSDDLLSILGGDDTDDLDLNAVPSAEAESTPSTPDVSDELDALLGEEEETNNPTEVVPEPVQELTPDSSFDDLDALLDDIASETAASETAASDNSVANLGADFGDEFNELDSLLGDELLAEEPSAPQTAAASPAVSTGTPSAGDDFADMEELLQQTESIGTGKATAPAPAATPAAAPASKGRSRTQRLVEQSMRVPVKTLDNLSNLVGEMVVTRNSLEGDQERLRMALDKLGGHTQQLSDVGQKLQDLYERSLLENALLNSRRKVMGEENMTPAGIAAAVSTHSGSQETDDLDDLELDRFTGFHTLSQDIIELIVRIKESTDDIDFLINESLDQVARNFRQTTSQLQEDVNRSRMVPFSQTADRLPRAVREISRKCGKAASLTVDGRETLVDKMLVEQLHDPLTHLINNAVTHGIETQDERILAGKSPTGDIRLQAFYQGNQTVISIVDDGAGIDPEVVKRKAIEKGLVRRDEAENLGVSQIYDFLFHAGFSTRDKADAFAGRGVGMDVVRTRLQELRGTIVIDSEVGKGTTFTIRLPLTLSITKALHCISNRARIAFPFDGVEDMFDIPRDQLVKNEEDQSCIQWREMLLPVRELSDLLRYNRTIGRSSVYAGTSDEDMLALVILRSAGEYLAINVDRVEGEMDIVIKQLEGPVPKPTGIAGATVLADGQVMPIADVLELIDLAKGRTRQGASALWEDEQGIDEPTATPATDPLVLIVDDSITVRELLSMSFAKYGYRVEQARDGQEAWEKLRSGLPCNLIFCDIEMPRMTGLELLERMQKDEYLSTLPIAMLTSRGADRHRNLAAKFGARGYFTKPYLEESLLEAAGRLLKGEVLINQPAESDS